MKILAALKKVLFKHDMGQEALYNLLKKNIIF
jgi:hypothetical protein